MLLQEAYTKISEKTGLSSTSTTNQARIRRAIVSVLKEMYRRSKYITLMEENYITTVDGTSDYVLDSRYLYGLNFKDRTETTSSGTLEVYTRRRFDKEYPNPTTDTATPSLIYPLKKIWVSAQPTSASKISLSSSSASDVTSYYVVVRGIVSGVEVSERVTLTGATAALTTNTYTSLISITKDSTVGTVTATSNSAAVTNIILLPTETEKSFWLCRLYPTPDDEYIYYYTFQRKPWDFSSYDQELIPFDDNFEDVLILFVTAIILKDQGDQKWSNTWQMAEAKINEIMDNDYFSEDTDKRMGLIELNNQDGDNW